MGKLKAWLDNLLWVPDKLVDKKLLKKHFRVDHFDDKKCRTFDEGRPCPELDEKRPTEVCKGCVNYKGRFDFFKSDPRYPEHTGLMVGRPDLVRKAVHIDHVRVKDRTAHAPVSKRIKIKKDFVPKEHQTEAVEAALKHRQGFIIAPPRSGKTVIGMLLFLATRERMLIILHQDDLADQFLNTFRQFTNMEKLESKGQVPVIIASKPEDFFGDHDVVISTYQRFMSKKGRKLLKKVRKRFGTTLVDEGHKSNATMYSKVMSAITSYRRYAMTGTDKRKDGLHFIANYIIGATLYRAKIPSLQPVLAVYEGSGRDFSRKLWVFMMKAMYKDAARNKLIVKKVMFDLELGRSIIIPIAGNREQCERLCAMINKAWMNKKKTTKQIAEPFYRYKHKAQKQAVLERARSGKTRCIVGMRSMLLGVDVPRWDVLYACSPINNPPNWEQESRRICTPMEGKPTPVIRFFVDYNTPAAVRCFEATFQVSKKLGYIVSDQATEERTRIMMKSKMGNTRWQDAKAKADPDAGPVTIGVPGRKLSF